MLIRPEPKVTVVIPTYNREILIRKAIESVLKQTLKEWKLLVIDDASTDKTRDYIEQLQQVDKRINYFRMSQNSGICKVLNTALKLIDTEYMVQLDSDDWLEPEALDVLLREMENASSKTALAYGSFMKWKQEGKNTGDIHKGRSFFPSDKYEFICHNKEICPRFYRVSCLREVGGWDINDSYEGRYLEDRRIMFKLIEKYEFLCIDQVLYNVRRFENVNRLTLPENRRKYIQVKKEIITRTLKRWGSEYLPEFSISKKGWLKVKLRPYKK